ncbi:GNAT family N-acetyltransferase [Segniliparus rugosus]|uniref:N-acetyltransferase domain-containing protein n=1 Tax=Segniliparus rugosus (strain ATCC BAA-974 / DSM 45345 / CCUG 50838 / CIP 108380 / JCM 13579 / CDC 945) TaxID=679197 RepID=E5XUY0_SEGRC|nr:GNAT family N-acetyltransferase [Segniliparus rugosus]EFV11816.2 hypothetical protein HMPREF9336_03302 [Segniliparus rugosus ATCC BAA-974]
MRQAVLAGDGVWLSAPTVADVPAIARCCQEPGLAEMTSAIPIPFAEADARHFITETVEPEWARGTAASWAVRLSLAGEAVGMVGLNGCGTYLPPVEPRHGRDGGFVFDHAELGYWLSARARSRGIMTEAARLVCGFGFEKLHVRGIRWRALVGNVPSARVARRLGFRFDGVEVFDDWRGRDVDVWAASLGSGELRVSDEDPLPDQWPSEVAAGVRP